MYPTHPSQPGHPGVGPIHHGPVYPTQDVWPPAHERHHDYFFVEEWGGWWPSWFPYWDADWQAYWDYLYDYYGGDSNPEYAEYARDEVMRQIAVQQGWL